MLRNQQKLIIMKFDSITEARRAIVEAIKNNSELWDDDPAVRRLSSYAGIREIVVDSLATPQDAEYSFPRLVVVGEFTNTISFSGGGMSIDGYLITIILQHLYIDGDSDDVEDSHTKMLNKLILTIPNDFSCNTGIKHFYGISGSQKVEQSGFEVEN